MRLSKGSDPIETPHDERIKRSHQYFPDYFVPGQTDITQNMRNSMGKKPVVSSGPIFTTN